MLFEKQIIDIGEIGLNDIVFRLGLHAQRIINKLGTPGEGDQMGRCAADFSCPGTTARGAFAWDAARVRLRLLNYDAPKGQTAGLPASLMFMDVRA